MSNQKKYQKPINAVFAKPEENQIYYGDLEMRTTRPTSMYRTMVTDCFEWVEKADYLEIEMEKELCSEQEYRRMLAEHSSFYPDGLYRRNEDVD